jgi:hypothetical protein
MTDTSLANADLFVPTVLKLFIELMKYFDTRCTFTADGFISSPKLALTKLFDQLPMTDRS